MYEMNDILARLQKGEKAEDIANEIAAHLNAAIDAKEKADQEKEEAIKAAKFQEQKEKDAADLAESIVLFMNTYYPEFGGELTGQDILDLIDEIQNLIGGLKGLVSEIDTPKMKVSVKKHPVAKSDDDVIADFLRALGI